MGRSVGLRGVRASCRRGGGGEGRHHPRVVHRLESTQHAGRVEARRRLIEWAGAPQQRTQLAAGQVLEEQVHAVCVLVGGVELDHVGVGAHAHQPSLLHDDIERAAPQHLALGDGLERKGLARRRVLGELHTCPRAAAERRHHAQRTERDHGAALARYAPLAPCTYADTQWAERLATGRVGVAAQVEHEAAHLRGVRVAGGEGRGREVEAGGGGGVLCALCALCVGCVCACARVCEAGVGARAHTCASTYMHTHMHMHTHTHMHTHMHMHMHMHMRVRARTVSTATRASPCTPPSPSSAAVPKASPRLSVRGRATMPPSLITPAFSAAATAAR